MALEVISGNYYTSTNDIELNYMHPDHDVNWINYGNSTTEEEDAFWDTVLASDFDFTGNSNSMSSRWCIAPGLQAHD